MMGRRCYVLLRRRYDVPIRRRRDAPLRRLGDVPSRRRWVFHLRRTCDVTGTYRETPLRRRHDVLMPGGYIYKVSYIHSFFVIFNCNVFSALRAKHFEIWKNILWNQWVDCFIARSIMWYDILGVHSESVFPLMQYFFFSPKNCVSLSVLVSCLSLRQSAEIFLVNLLWGFSWKMLLPLE